MEKKCLIRILRNILLMTLVSLGAFANELNFRNHAVPEPSLHQLTNLTDHAGIFEHASDKKPNEIHGYCAEDVARALVAVLMYNRYYKDPQVQVLSRVYCTYLENNQSFNGNFHHRMDKFLETSEDFVTPDAYGRVLWGLGYGIAYPLDSKMSEQLKVIFDNSLKHIIPNTLISPRAASYAILGLYFYLQKYPDSEEVKQKMILLSSYLIRLYNKCYEKKWNWFENSITYDNARIPYALLCTYKTTGDPKFLQIGIQSLDFLLKINFPADDTLWIIGNNGWYVKGKSPSYFDQQPIDAGVLVEACSEAYRITGKEIYKKRMLSSFDWFLGKNSLGKPLYSKETGGCRDGLGKTEINPNQGAESSIMYLIARLTLREWSKL